MIWDILQESSFNEYFSHESLPTLTPEKLLLDENIITEFKNLNPQLIDYLQAHYDQFLARLIEYTIKLPHQNDGDDRVKKLPYVSSEVLAIDNQTLHKAFFDSPVDYFSHLMGLFATDAKHNEILSGYFVKILTNLYKSQKTKTALKIFSFKSVFFQNLDNEAVATVLTLFLVLLQTEQGFMLQQRKQVLHKLIQNLVTGNEPIKNVCKNVLAEVIAKFQTFSSGDQLLAEILNSQDLIHIFQIQDSPAVDDFLIAYMTKALQKICTSGQQQKSLFQIPQNHKEGIKTYIKSKNTFLQTQKLPKHAFTNQSQTQVYRLDRNVTKLLSLMKLAMENSIVGLLTENDITALFRIVFAHPSNDIIKVKIFDIFALIYSKKDIQAQEVFGRYFYQSAIELFGKEQKMYGHFLYQLWKVISKKLSKEYLESKDKEKWRQLLKYFELLESYEKEAQKVVDRYSNLTKVTKLVVDEEDTASNESTSPSQGQQNKVSKEEQKSVVKNNEQSPSKVDQFKAQTGTAKTNNTSIDAFSFDFFASNVSKPTQTKPSNVTGNKEKADPFAGFDFFATKSSNQTLTKQEDKKNADFNDFSSFF